MEAGAPPAVTGREGRRRLAPAHVGVEPAARRERAAGRQMREIGGQALDRLQLGCARPVEARHAAQQTDRVGVVRVVEERLRRPLLDDAPGVHDEDPAAHPGDHSEIVGDDDDRRAVLVRELLHEAQDLRLDGHVEGGGGLIGEKQLGVAREGHGDHHPLAHAARELMRVVLDAFCGFGDAHLLQHVDGTRDGRIVREAHVDLDALGHEAFDREYRVQAGHGVLEDHRDVAAAHLADLALLQGEEVAALELDAPAHGGVGRHARQTQDRRRRHALAAPGLADEPDQLARRDREAHLVDGAHGPLL
ncbi:MAG: hypothetical protein BWY94_02198 [Actinobacteria bacterium ADurb.BinA094]|nr:MAG: hypothetical protein BWY94_02198 [Actinobacteria bacterium ADurb.BinA094]